MIFGANGFAVSQPANGVQVTRLINGSPTETPQYLPGDNFVVELDYQVYGTQYAVSIGENLPDGWLITNSSVPYIWNPSDPRNYTWNISSPLTGVSSGKIFYLVQIPDDVGEIGLHHIQGRADWYSTYDDLTKIIPTDGYVKDPSNINVANSEGNGPCVWISTPREMAGKDNSNQNGHLETGEQSQFQFSIWDNDGIRNDYKIKVNGNDATIDSQTVDDGHVYGTAQAPMIANADPNNLVNTFSITANDTSGIQNSLSIPFYVPNYNYTVWAKGDYAGFPAEIAAVEPNSDLAAGGWLTLSGGKSIRIPDLSFNYNGPQSIDRDFTGMLPMDASAQLNITPHSLTVPFNTYPIYSVVDTANDVSATFNGTTAMNGKNFHVILVDLNITQQLTQQDIAKGEIGHADITATPDFTVDSSNIHALQGMAAGKYALLVLDYSMPNTPCIVAMTPIIVTKGTMNADQIYPEVPLPGDNIWFNLNVNGATEGKKMMYFAAMVPEKNYSAALHLASDGSAAGTSATFDGLTVKETITANPDDKTVTIHGMNGTYTYDAQTLRDGDVSAISTMLMKEFGAANVSFWNSSITTDTTDVEAHIQTTSKMPSGKYVMLSLAMDEDGNIVAVNQTYVDVGMVYHLPLVTGWNLVSFPVVNTTMMASDLAGTGVEIVAEYNNTTGDFNPYHIGVSRRGNFSLQTDVAYYFYSNEDTTFDIIGLMPENRAATLYNGWNMIGWSSFSSANASVVVAQTSLPGRQIVARLNYTTYDFDPYSEGVSRKDYQMHDGVGYFVFTSSSTPQLLHFEGL